MQNLKNVFKYLVLIIISLMLFNFYSIKTYASPLNDFTINMNVSGDEDSPVASLQTTGGNSSNDNFFGNVLNKYHKVIIGVFGIATLTSVCMFIFGFMKLGSSAGNIMERQRALNTLLWAGISSALLGGVCLFVFFSYGLLK